MNRRKFVTRSVAALSAGRTLLASSGLSRSRPESQHRILYNDDGHTIALASGLDDLLEKAVDRFIGTQVDALLWSIGHSDIYLFKTRTGEMYGTGVKQFMGAGGLKMYQGLQNVLRDREDYMQAMADRCREIGIQFFVTMRMNDCHDSPQGWNSSDQYSHFKKANPELLLGSSVHPSFATGYDFAYPQSRQNKFQVIEEILLDYDIDGIELDFLRHPAFFKPNEAYRKRHLITALVRKVRAVVDKMSVKRGRAIRLAVRVPSSFTIAQKLGFDVPVWIEEEGLLDIVTCGTPRSHELGLKMLEYVEATRGNPITLLGQIGLYHPLKETRAAALNYWRQGFEGIYLFNWYAPLADPKLWRESLVEIGDPEILSHKSKEYLVDVQVGQPWIYSHPKGQLPLKIEEMGSGGRPRVTFHVADDVKGAAGGGKAARVELVMRFEQVLEDDDLELRLNGALLLEEKEEWQFEPTLFGRREWLHLPVDAGQLKLGFNQLELVLRKRNPRVAAPLLLAELKLRIDYVA